MTSTQRLFALIIIASLVPACGDDSAPTDGGVTDATSSDGSMMDASMMDASIAPPTCGVLPAPPDPACTPTATDYAPDATDMWPACVSDDGDYHRIEPVISSEARVAAFEEIAPLLFDPTADPSADDFIAARLIYQEDQGIDSRVVRRYDPHFSVPDGTDCTAPGVAEMFPDYCVGPGLLSPMILDEFAAGATGSGSEPARVHAARIEAGLLWFFYVSSFKESLTCSTKPKDCDSSYAYYTGGAQAGMGTGLSARVRAVAPEADARAFDGFLALRCWRDLDMADTATDLERRDWARGQFDRAELDGVAAILRTRLGSLCGLTGPELAYQWAFLQTLAP
ncbi:MAG: hypothetical protein GXP55_19465, partial [Deltaproteobacteria bacterium]|nr:hypothetical protein [Deltaproteobacteria bacterium]